MTINVLQHIAQGKLGDAWMKQHIQGFIYCNMFPQPMTNICPCRGAELSTPHSQIPTYPCVVGDGKYNW